MYAEYEPMICPVCDDPCHLLSHLSVSEYDSDIGGRRDMETVCVDFDSGVLAIHDS